MIDHQTVINYFIAEINRVTTNFVQSDRSSTEIERFNRERAKVERELVQECIKLGDSLTDANKTKDAAYTLYGLGLRATE